MKNTPDSPNKKTRTQPIGQLSWIYAVLAAILLVGIGILSGYLLWGKPLQTIRAAEAAAQAAVQATASAPREVNRYDIAEDDDYAYGPADAPITIIEFSDYQCPYCQKWHLEVWPLLQAAYGDEIRLVYRDFPLYSIHPEAGPAAEAANCAGEQGDYYGFHNLLLTGSLDFSEEAYLGYAEILDLDISAFSECVQSGRYTAEVEADSEYALSMGIQSTPTFFINGIALIGAQGFEVFQEVIELELAGKLTP